MSSFLDAIDAVLRGGAGVLLGLGGFGLLIMGVLDSSFLFMPLGNDLLMIAMTARKHSYLLYYAAMAAAGSVAGCLILDTVFRKGGEAMLEKHVPRNRLDYVRNRVNRRAGWALAFATLMPPPFPFTPLIAVAAVLEYPRRKMLSIIGACRMVRFSGLGLLGIFWGRRIINVFESEAFKWAVFALVVLSIGGSAVEILRWVKKSKHEGQRPDVRRAA